MKKIIAILLCVSSLFALCACGSIAGGSGAGSEVEPSEAPAAEETEAPAVEESAAPVEKPEVYYTLDESGSYTDSVGNTYSYSYKIPAFTGGSEYAEQTNKSFEDTLRPIIENELDSMQKGLSLNVNSVICDVYESGDITSVLVSVQYPNDYVEYYTASMNTAENRGMNNADLAAALGIDEADLPDALRSAATAAVEKQYADYGDISGEGFAEVRQMRDQTLTDIASDEWEPTLFINGEGKVCFVCDVMSPVAQFVRIFEL